MQTEKKYFKILKSNRCHNGYLYKKGLNKIDNFQEHGSCVPGRLYFSEAKDICRYLYYGEILVEVFLPIDDPEFKIMPDPSGGKYGANKIILGDEYDLSDPKTFEFMIECRINIDKNQVLIWSLEKNYMKIFKFLIKRIVLNLKYLDIIMKYIQRYISNKKYKDVIVLMQMVLYYKDFFNVCNIEHVFDNVNIEYINNIDKDALLYAAIKLNDYDIAKYLILIGADIFSYDHNTFTHAVLSNNIEFIECLILRGENVSVKNNFAILNACREKNLHLVKKFISLGADIRDNVKVFEAIGHLNFDYLDLLLSQGSKIILNSDDLYIKISDINDSGLAIKIIKCLQKYGYSINYCKDHALINAIHNNNFDLVGYWYDNGANINILFDNLHKINNSLIKRNIFKFLLNKNIDLDLNFNAYQDLSNFILDGDNIMLEYLIKKGYLMSSINIDLFLQLIRNNDIKKIEFLVKNNFDFKSNGNKALMTAILLDKNDIVKYLVSLYDHNIVSIISKYNYRGYNESYNHKFMINIFGKNYYNGYADNYILLNLKNIIC
ncbi:repeat protein [Cotonvirus japonicus]|uniref:Repeat protein n=1 Tax=Cotonvirus japonicus TaxID=2811091 RepID=A0ABM7NTR6_9VIRU|nr:repeat protein [Cotonvirus japonicus]BCS83565.1 repeat protein [Cotonvirus japonicus]